MATTIIQTAEGANGVSFFVEDADPPPSIDIGAAYWAALPPGKLKDLLDRDYADVPAFYQAFSDAGGALTPMSPVTAARFNWVMESSPEPSRVKLQLSNGVSLASIRITVAYSASA